MSKESDGSIQLRIDELRTRIRALGDPKGNAFRCGMDFTEALEGPLLLFSIFNIPAKIIYPELVARKVLDGKSLNTMYQALTCFYMVTSAAYPPYHQIEKNWVSFSQLPDGRFYNQAFQGYTGNILAPVIEKDIKKFSNIAERMNGVTLDLGDMSYQFLVLPKVPVAIVFWMGDEDFPSSCKILFDGSACMHLPVDACAIVGSMLTQSILKGLYRS